MDSIANYCDEEQNNPDFEDDYWQQREEMNQDEKEQQEMMTTKNISEKKNESINYSSSNPCRINSGAAAENINMIDLTKNDESTIDAWMIRLSDGDYKTDIERPRISIVNRTVSVVAVQINHNSAPSEGTGADQRIPFKERTIGKTIGCGEIFKCHGRNLAFVGLAHLKDPVVSSYNDIFQILVSDVSPPFRFQPSQLNL